MARAPLLDNSNLLAKLDLRRYMMHKYHAAEPPRVIDCCAGDGVLWRHLRSEFRVRSYWPIDVKPAPGRLAFDSARILTLRGWAADLVDVDTYGSPWAHWCALLPNVPGPLSIVLTEGDVIAGQGREIANALGLGRLRPPITLVHRLRDLGRGALIAQANDHGLRIVEAVQTVTAGKHTYMAVRVEPIDPAPTTPPKQA